MADATNVCLPQSHPVDLVIPGLPTTEAGARCALFGITGPRSSLAGNQKDCIVYGSRNQVIVRSLTTRDNNTTATSPQSPPCINDVIRQSAFGYRGHAQKATVSAVRANPAGTYIASGDSLGQLRIWALDNPDHRCKYEQRVLTDIIRDIDWDGEGKRICLTGERARTDNSACSKALQWDTGTTLGSLGVHEKGRANSCSMKPNRPFRLVTAGNDDARLLFHKGGPPFVVETNGPDVERVHHKGKAIHAVRYSPNGEYIASVSADRCLNIYRFDDGTTTTTNMKLVMQETAAHAATIYDVAWNPTDNTTLLTASGDGTCKLWKLENNCLIKEYKTYHIARHQNGDQPFITTTKVPPGAAQVGCDFVNAETAIAVSLNGQLSILKPDDTIQTITGHASPIADCCIAKDAFYTCDSEGIVVQWDIHSCQPMMRLSNDVDLFHKVHKGAVTALAVVQGKLFSVGYDDQLRITKDRIVQHTSTPLGAQPIAMASGTNLAVVVTAVQSLLLIDANGTILDTQTNLSYEGLCVTVTKDDTKAYVGGKDNVIHVYDIVNGTGWNKASSATIITGHRKPVHSLALSKDETKLASGDDQDICVWDLTAASNTPMVGPGKWCFHTQRVTRLAWSPDGHILASAGADDAIFLWCLESKMKRLHYKFCHRGGINGLHFLSDRKLISAGVDAAVQVWDVSNDVKAKFG